MNKKRKSISKSKRFKIFKRDEFTCMYCGRSPENHNITLEVDHKISVRDGGGDEEENLTTSCFDCNRGKSKSSVVSGSLKDKTQELEEIKERLEQIRYIHKLNSKIKIKKQEIEDSKVEFVNNLLDGYSDNFIRKVKIRIKNQNERYGRDFDLMEECLTITLDKFSEKESFYPDNFMKYFHGVLNNKI